MRMRRLRLQPGATQSRKRERPRDYSEEYHRRNPPLKPNESIVRTTARCRGGPRRLPTTYCQIRLSNRGLGRENVATVRLMRAQTLFDCGTENPIGGQRARGGADWSCVKT